MKNYRSFWLWILPVFVSTLSAMTLDIGTIVQVNTNEDSKPYGYHETFAVSNEVVVWLDERGSDGYFKLYGIQIDDPTRTEFLIDPSISGAHAVALSGHRVLYKSQEYPSPNVLRIADVQNPASPQIYTIQPEVDVHVFDIGGPWVAFAGFGESTGYLYAVFAVDCTNPQQPQFYQIANLPENTFPNSLAIENPYLVWVESSDEDSVVKIADLTNPNNPSIRTIPLPAGVTIQTIRVSDNNLIGRGWQESQMVLYVVRNYRSPQPWNIQIIRPGGVFDEYLHSGPQIDGSLAVWVTMLQGPSYGAGLDGGTGTLQTESGWKLKAVSVHNLEGITTLLSTPYENEIRFADIAGRQIVWSQGETYISSDLFKGFLILECGDWGYKAGDINKDCSVNLLDLALLAQNWLACTVPDQADCEFGS